MNSVSWFIYLAGVAANIGGILTFLGVATLFLCGSYGIFSTIAASVDADKFTLCPPKARFVAMGFIVLLVAAVIPDKNTMYAIAASQVGEKIVMSQQVQGVADDASKALQQWIRDQIDPEKSKKR